MKPVLQLPVNRRQFLLESSKTACAAGLLAGGVLAYSKSNSALASQALRPPAALPENEFLAACLRCGLCVEACPYDTLKLARPFDDAPTGTPYFTARKVACEMCDDIPCAKACPSGALDKHIENINDARMGVAVLIDHQHCLNYQGLRCDVCYRVCPLIDEAINLELQHNTRTGKHAFFLPVVNSDVCTGCGKCEQACVMETAAIKVLPREIAVAKGGDHYQLGWEEKAAAGESLVPNELTLPVRRPEGL